MTGDGATAKKNEEIVYQYLEKLNIDYECFTHEPVYTIEQAEKQLPDLDVSHCKNLFLRNNKGNQHYLVIIPGEKSANLKDLAQKIQSTRLTFGSERRLNKYLKLDKGAVSPFGLINDEENHVEVIVDRDIKNKKGILLHPNANTASILIQPEDLEKFLESCGNNYKFIDIPIE